MTIDIKTLQDKDYSKRRSELHDDRDGDVITTLGNGIVKVCEGPAPTMAFFLVPSRQQVVVMNDDDDLEQGGKLRTVEMQVVGYVNMNALSKVVQEQIREELALARNSSR